MISHEKVFKKMNKTAREIAKISGFSISTVSKVLNDRPGINAETRLKIRKIAEELNYFPYCKPRLSGLSERRFKYVGLITSQRMTYIYSEMEWGLESTMSKSGYHILKMILDENDSILTDKEMFFNKLIDDKSIAGLISISISLSDKTIDHLNRNGIPVVIIDKYTDFGKCVLIDNTRAVHSAIKKLISLGHKKIGFITPEASGNDIWNERLTGYKNAVKESGIGYDPELVEYENTFNLEFVEIATRNLINRIPDLSAIMYISDTMAIPGMKAIQNMGLKVPGNISVIGFDNINFDKYLTPTLSSVKQPAYEIGKKASNMLLKSMKVKNTRHEAVYMDTELILRESVRSIP
jgi:LacI family transcriptional regulator